MAEFELNGIPHRTTKLQLFDAAHIARKLAPVVGRIGPTAMAVYRAVDPAALAAASAEDKSNLLFEHLEKLLVPATEELALMPRADFESIISTCLSTCQRQQGGVGWVAVWNVQAARPQFDDIDLVAMFTIVFRVVADQLGPFFRGPALTSIAPG